jgi:hypothetical protein
VDVLYRDLVTDPVTAVASIYERTGRTWTDEHARRVLGYLAAKPKDRHGRHGYSAAEWGIDADAVRSRLRPYLDRFGVPVET